MSGRKISILLVLTSIFLYGNTLLNGWGMDDIFVLKDNAQVMNGISGLPEIFSSQYYSGPGANFGYRPLTKAMFAVEYDIFGINLPVHHLINVLMYCLCVLLVFRLLNRYLKDSFGITFVLLACLIWLLHPVHTEVVASLKNREEMLWVILGLLSLEQTEKYIEKSSVFYLISALVLFSLSFLAKQSALSLVLVLPLLFWYKYGISYSRLFETRNIRIIISLLVFFLSSYLFYRISYRLFSNDNLEIFYFENPLRYSELISKRVSISLISLFFYLKILIIPHPLIFYYGLHTIPELSISSFPVILSLTTYFLLIVVFIFGFRKRTAFSFGFGFYLLAIFMFSNFPENVNGIIGERLLFFPSIGFSVALASVIYMIFKLKRQSSLSNFSLAAKTIIVILLLFYAGKTVVRNNTWKDSLALFKNDIRYAQNSVQINQIIAGEMMDRMVEKLQKGEPAINHINTVDSIIMLYKRAWSLYPENYRALNNIGDIFMTFKNRPDSAHLFLAGAYKLEPDNFYVNYNIARGYEMKKDYKKALRFYSKAKSIKPEKEQTDQSITRIEILLKNMKYQ